MSEARMMKVQDEVKKRVEQLKAKLPAAKSESDVIAHLLEYYDRRELHIELKKDDMAEVKKTKEYLRVQDEAATVKIMNHYFSLALSYPLTVFEMIQQHQRYSRY